MGGGGWEEVPSLLKPPWERGWCQNTEADLTLLRRARSERGFRWCCKAHADSLARPHGHIIYITISCFLPSPWRDACRSEAFCLIWQEVCVGLKPVEESQAVPEAVTVHWPTGHLCRVRGPHRWGSRVKAGLTPRISAGFAGYHSAQQQDHGLSLAGYLAEKRNLRSEPQYHERQHVSKLGAWAGGVRAERCSPQRSVCVSHKCVRKGAGVRVPATTRDAQHKVAAGCPTSTRHRPRCTRAHNRLR